MSTCSKIKPYIYRFPGCYRYTVDQLFISYFQVLHIYIYFIYIPYLFWPCYMLWPSSNTSTTRRRLIQVRITRAANPSDILWENLSVRPWGLEAVLWKKHIVYQPLRIWLSKLQKQAMEDDSVCLRQELVFFTFFGAVPALDISWPILLICKVHPTLDSGGPLILEILQSISHLV